MANSTETQVVLEDERCITTISDAQMWDWLTLSMPVVAAIAWAAGNSVCCKCTAQADSALPLSSIHNGPMWDLNAF